MANYEKERRQLEAVRQQLDVHLAGFAQRLGLKSLKLGNCKFTPDGFTFKLDGVFAGGQSKEETAYEALREWKRQPMGAMADGRWHPEAIPGFELPPLGTLINTNGQQGKMVTVVGARPRAQFNVIVADKQGRRTCYRDVDIARLYKKQYPAVAGALT